MSPPTSSRTGSGIQSRAPPVGRALNKRNCSLVVVAALAPTLRFGFFFKEASRASAARSPAGIGSHRIAPMEEGRRVAAPEVPAASVGWLVSQLLYSVMRADQSCSSSTRWSLSSSSLWLWCCYEAAQARFYFACLCPRVPAQQRVSANIARWSGV